jgi:hypothetical protein
VKVIVMQIIGSLPAVIDGIDNSHNEPSVPTAARESSRPHVSLNMFSYWSSFGQG